jgi:DNA-binding MarR family transcriptional regulator
MSSDISLCNCTAIRKAARHMTRFYDACLAEVGLRGTQYIILRSLSAHGPMTINALAEVMVMDRTTVTHNVKPLQRDGLVGIEVDPTDKRSRIVALTKRGVASVRQGEAAWAKAQAQFESRFGKAKALEMRKVMSEVTNTELVTE